MDIWIVAAAAGAGYVAQHLKNLTRGKSCPFGRVLSREERKKVCGADAYDSDIASTSGYKDENLVLMDNFASYSTASGSMFLNEKDFEGNWESSLPSGNGEVFTSDLSPHGIGFSFNSRRKKRSSLMSRRINSQFIKPRTSLESCLLAQLYEEDAEIEEHTYCLHPLQKPTMRPFLVTDGSRVISSAPLESFRETRDMKCQQCKDAYSRENKTVFGVPTLPNVVPVELQKKAKTRNKEHVLGRIDSRKFGLGNQDNAKGTSDGVLLFYLGLAMGMISSFMANKQEVETLKSSLKQTENLVQDLQEELEMKDSVIVKEIAAEDYELQDVHNDHCFDDDDVVRALPLEKNINEDYCNQTSEDKSLSNIEAELEAELQRLESHMNSSSLEGKLCNLAELDPELVSDVHEGGQLDGDGSRSSTPRSVHYPVSPRDLSLRLHQVIQSRLEERVKELETALENSQRKVKYMESEHMLQSREVSNDDSTQDSPIAGDGQESIDQPVIINLSGEALAAYNEACTELTKVSMSDEEDVEVVFEDGYHVENGDMDHQRSACVGSLETVFDRRTEEDVYSAWSSSRDEIEDDDDELIRQIVEKAKQGSPAVLKAQKALLLSTNEN